MVILDLGLARPQRLRGDRSDPSRASTVPIIVLSARSDERSKVEALDLGADDYISKPFGMAELTARIRAALRHRFQAQGELPVFVSGDLTVDLVRRRVTRAGHEIKLSPKEFELLRHLVAHAGKVLTHRHLLREVWGPAQADEVQYLRVFIRGLRQKLEPDPTRPTHILTELGSVIGCNYHQRPTRHSFDPGETSDRFRAEPGGLILVAGMTAFGALPSFTSTGAKLAFPTLSGHRHIRPACQAERGQSLDSGRTGPAGPVAWKKIFPPRQPLPIFRSYSLRAANSRFHEAMISRAFAMRISRSFTMRRSSRRGLPLGQPPRNG